MSLKNRRARKRKAIRRNQVASYGTLEKRQLMAGDLSAGAALAATQDLGLETTMTSTPGRKVEAGVDANGNINIIGTNEADNINISQNQKGRVVVRSNDKVIFRTPARQTINRILVDAHAGDDNVQNDTSINSVITGGRGKDTLVGGSGQDTLMGQRGIDTLKGRQGDDMLEGGRGANVLQGGNGHDTADTIGDNTYLSIETRHITASSPAFNPTASPSPVSPPTASTPAVSPSQGIDAGGGAASTPQATTVNPTEALASEAENNPDTSTTTRQAVSGYTFENGVLTIQGTDASESFSVREDKGYLSLHVGGRFVPVAAISDVSEVRLFAGAGDDTVFYRADVPLTAYGEGGNDRMDVTSNIGASLYGGDGDDHIRGGTGNDRIWGGAGNDNLQGVLGHDELHGDSGADRLIGGDGNDTMYGGGGADEILGDRGNDRLFGGKGADRLSGGTGNDELRGNRGHDRLDGGENDDKLWGGNGHDTLSGGNGIDKLWGGKGRDQLVTLDSVFDKLFGGKGQDSFHIDGANTTERI